MQAQGEFEDFDDLKSNMEKKEFEELRQKGSVIDRPTPAGKQLAWNPTRSMTITMEQVLQEERKRQLE
eukprot:584811-Pyramimonas_sp.AAC.1